MRTASIAYRQRRLRRLSLTERRFDCRATSRLDMLDPLAVDFRDENAL